MPRPLHSALIGVAILLTLTLAATVATPRAAACIWDRDTLETEAKGLPGVLDIISGKFVTHPHEYYRMRLERVTAEIEASPDDLALYDDAGVACDRIGRGEAAIAWMERKRERLDALAVDDPEHRYRYLANLGTFVVHHWLREEADPARIAEVERARDLIAAAIELNPDAHFGRERYQLKALEWLIRVKTLPTWKSRTDSKTAWGEVTSDSFAAHLGLERQIVIDAERSQLASLGMDDAVEGLSGLIVLGGARYSVDMHHALAAALQTAGHSSLAYMARMRASELQQSSFPPLAASLASGDYHSTEGGLVEDVGPLVVEYKRRVAEASAWEARRAAYELGRLGAGDHPDTNPAFWDAFEAGEATLTTAAPVARPGPGPVPLGILPVAVVGLVLLAILAWFFIPSRKRK